MIVNSQPKRQLRPNRKTRREPAAEMPESPPPSIHPSPQDNTSVGSVSILDDTVMKPHAKPRMTHGAVQRLVICWGSTTPSLAPRDRAVLEGGGTAGP